MIRRFSFAAGIALSAAGAAPPAEPIEVAAFYFPGYHPTPRNDARLGKGWTEWELVRAARPRFPGHGQPKEPLWGYEDESDPAAMAKKIDAAADHGVTAFIFDWYWHEDGPFLDGALEKGFLEAPNRVRLKFCVMWANHDWIDIFPAKAGVPPKLLYPGAVSRETFERATDHVIRAYFPRPNHWKIDGRPVFSIYEMMTLVKGLGGMEKAREALDGFRSRARAAGFPGIHLNGVAWGIQPAGLAPSAAEMVRALGIDSVTSYCWIHHQGPGVFPETPYPEWARKSMDLWPKFRREWPVPYFPNVSMGWDSSPRTTQGDEFRNAGYPYTPVLAGNTPAEFRKALEGVKRFLEEQDKGPRAFTINAWNAWTEGSYLEPDRANGFAYLEAIRSVFGKAAPAGAAGPGSAKDRLGRGINVLGYDPTCDR